jgi:putative ATP-dependent endonuclease of OLD family
MDRKAGAKAQRLVQAAGLTIHDVYDLDRYLDATRGALLFARGVILVEGSAEQIIVPLYAMNIGIDLHRDGIQIVAVNGIHFDAYTKLLGINGIGKPHVVLTDGDDFRKDGSLVANYDDGANHSSLEGIFKNRTTFEYAITQPESLDGLLETARAFGLRNLPKAIAGIKTAGIYSREEFATLQVTVLRAAQDVGKARFAQRFGEEVTRRQLPPPEYIELAIRSIHASVHPERAEEFPQP